jgi:hypothetical protein
MLCFSVNVQTAVLSKHIIFGVNIVPERNNDGITTVLLSSLVHLSLNSNLPHLDFKIQKNHLHQNSKPEHYFRVVAFVSAVSSPKEQCWSYMSSSTIISFQSTESIFTGTRNQNSFFRFVIFIPLVSSPKQKKGLIYVLLAS